MIKVKYHDMLKDDIREFVSLSGCDLDDIIARVRERDIDLEHLRKRRPQQTQIAVGQVKRPKTQDSCSRGH